MRYYTPALLIFATVIFTLSSLPVAPITTVEPMHKSLPSPTTAVLVDLAEPPKAKTESYPAYPLKDWERTLICRVMMSECPSEPAEGQRAVAQVILDRLLSSHYPDTVYEVLTQPNQFAAPTETDINDDVSEAVSAVWDRGYRVTNDELLFFYSPQYGKGKWHEQQAYIITIGGHKFFN